MFQIWGIAHWFHRVLYLCCIGLDTNALVLLALLEFVTTCMKLVEPLFYTDIPKSFKKHWTILYLLHHRDILKALSASKSSLFGSVLSRMGTVNNLVAFLYIRNNFCCKMMVNSGYLYHFHDTHDICACNQKIPLVIPEHMSCYNRVDALDSMYLVSTSCFFDWLSC